MLSLEAVKSELLSSLGGSLGVSGFVASGAFGVLSVYTVPYSFDPSTYNDDLPPWVFVLNNLVVVLLPGDT